MAGGGTRVKVKGRYRKSLRILERCSVGQWTHRSIVGTSDDTGVRGHREDWHRRIGPR
jgi:hypothetical protein